MSFILKVTYKLDPESDGTTILRNVGNLLKHVTYTYFEVGHFFVIYF